MSPNLLASATRKKGGSCCQACNSSAAIDWVLEAPAPASQILVKVADPEANREPAGASNSPPHANRSR
jgi:hypothetical protein